jgi:PleD family two-component response regulator
LPHTHAHEAADLARRIYTAVNDAKITVGMEKLSASVVLGIASIPGDVATAGELLAAAEMAKEKAHNLPEPVQLFSDLS